MSFGLSGFTFVAYTSLFPSIEAKYLCSSASKINAWRCGIPLDVYSITSQEVIIFPKIDLCFLCLNRFLKKFILFLKYTEYSTT